MKIVIIGAGVDTVAALIPKLQELEGMWPELVVAEGCHPDNKPYTPQATQTREWSAKHLNIQTVPRNMDKIVPEELSPADDPQVKSSNDGYQPSWSLWKVSPSSGIAAKAAEGPWESISKIAAEYNNQADIWFISPSGLRLHPLHGGLDWVRNHITQTPGG